MSLAFQSNGLLSDAPAEEGTHGTKLIAPPPPQFKSNGLLPPPPDASTRAETSLAFMSNGLLPFSSPRNDLLAGPSSSPADYTVPAVQAINDIARMELDIPESLASSSMTGVPTESIITASYQRPRSVSPERPFVDPLDEDCFPNPSQLLPSPAGPSTSSGSRTFIRGTSFDGKSVFIQKKRKEYSWAESVPTRYTGSLLEVPIHRLMDQLSENAIANLNKLVPERPEDPTAGVEEQLWVDRYRPEKFTELVGDERVHREAMAWLKEWDECVFKKKKKKPKAKETVIGKKRGWDDGDGGDAGRFAEKDEFGRPRERILLLSGPPGLGKTTLAHVIANQAGYTVLEINASDARSGSIVEDRLKPALEAGIGLGSTKPVLVVVDEIDGATGDTAGGFVDKLVRLTLDKPRRKRGEKRGGKDKRPLLRPIICICNDLYAKPLATLRQHARMVKFTPAAPVHLVKRLKEICVLENLVPGTRALSTLVAIAKGDMRGCLNTLQFIKTRSKTVTEAQVRAATVGMKETETSLQVVWKDIFTPLGSKRAKDLGMTEDEEARYVQRLARLVEGSEAIEKVALGCFEHYANLHRHDPTWRRYQQGLDWLCTYDTFSTAMRGEQEYALMPYLSYAIVPLHPLFAATGNPKVERPQADWECYEKKRMNEQISKTLSLSILSQAGRRTPGYRHLLNQKVLQMEFAPLINRIISPPLRPINSQVIRADEKALLKKLVDIMVSLELRFVQEQAEDGQTVYRLDPPIDVFVTYDGKRAPDISVSRYAVRHMVAAEIEAEVLLRQATAQEKGVGSKKHNNNFFGARTQNLPGAEDDGDGILEPAEDNADTSRAKKAEKNKVIDIADRPPTDFFGRVIAKPIALEAGSKAEGPPKKKYKVTYRFNEGNSAAVRRPVKISTLL